MRHHVLAAVACATLAAGTLHAQPPEELVERTLAIVAGRAVTLADVRTAMALGLLPDSSNVEEATERLVERALVLREVERYAPPEPEERAIDDTHAEIRRRLSEPAIAAALTSGGFTEARLRAWIRDNLRIASYLEQRFAATADLPVEPVAPQLRERVSAERRASLIADWIASLRRRTPVVELWKR